MTHEQKISPKNEPQPKPHTLYKNLLKINHRLPCKTIKLVGKTKRKKIFGVWE